MTLRELELTEVVRTVASLSERTHPPTSLPRLTFAVSRKSTWLLLLLLPSSPSSSLLAAAGRRKTISSSKISSRRPPPFRRRSAPLDPPMMASPVPSASSARPSHRRSDPGGGGRGYYEMGMTLWDLRDRRRCSQPPFDFGNCECAPAPSIPPSLPRPRMLPMKFRLPALLSSFPEPGPSQPSKRASEKGRPLSQLPLHNASLNLPGHG